MGLERLRDALVEGDDPNLRPNQLRVIDEKPQYVVGDTALCQKRNADALAEQELEDRLSKFQDFWRWLK